MDAERMLIGKLAYTGQIENVLSAGISENHFDDEVAQAIFTFMAEHTRKYKGPPSLKVCQEEFPNYNFELPTDTLEYVKERFIKATKRRFAYQALTDLAEQIDESDDIDGAFLEQARRLSQMMPTSAIHRYTEMERRIEKYEAGETVQAGIMMGIPVFDKLTMGIQKHELVSVVGWQGTGKSTLTQWILFNAWMQEKTGMLISLEMEHTPLFRKWDTMLTNFEYNALKAGTLSEHDLENWRIKAKLVTDKSGDIIVKDQVQRCTVDYVYAEAIRYQPDIIAIDYVSLMDTSRSAGNQMWEKVTYLTQSLKQVARSTGIPIIAVAQTNIGSASEGAKLDNIAYSRSIGQDSDIVLGLHQDEEMKDNKQMTVRMLKNRDGETIEEDMFWDMAHMRFASWNETEVYRRKAERAAMENAA
jgi:replicative DNA helicase